MNRIKSFRRSCLLLAFDAVDRLEMGLASALWGRQEAEPGTALPISTPGYDRLIANHYKTVEDVDGADPKELMKLAGLNHRDAQAVFTALGLTYET